MNRNALITLIALSLITLTSCGGSSGDSPQIQPPPPPPPPPSKGIEGSGIITGFGKNFVSVSVNGQVFDTTNPGLVVTVDDQMSTVDQLKVGQVVTIIATTDDGGVTVVADSIAFDNEVEGPIDAGSINLMQNRFEVLGQMITVSGATVFDDDIDPRSLAGLMDGDFVEVSGFIDSSGSVQATRIERQQAGSQEFEVRGSVSAIDTTNKLFNINALVVNYAGAQLEDFPGPDPMNGDFVEAEGMNVNMNGELVATRVELEDEGLPANDDADGEIEGFITRFVSPADFDVAGQAVTTNAQTVFEDGTAADLALDVLVEAEGTFDANGVLVASKIEFEDAAENPEIEIEATADAVDTMASTVTLLGITVQVDASTRLEDKSNAKIEPFTLDDIAVGDFLVVRGFEDPPASGNVTATLLERDDFDPDVLLQGRVDSVNDPDFVILGITIQTNAGTSFEDVNEQPITSTDFFNMVMSGSLVKAKGAPSGQTIVADEVEFEE